MVASEGQTRADVAGRAERDLRVIRETMERSRRFDAVPGWGIVGIGILGLTVALFASALEDGVRWSLLWSATAAVGFAGGIFAVALEARARGAGIATGAAGRFWSALLPVFGAGGVLTILAVRHGSFDGLPTLWLLIYGSAVTVAGRDAVRLVPLMGISFMVLGVLSAFSPSRDASMGAGFGALHVVFGYLIARSHRG